MCRVFALIDSSNTEIQLAKPHETQNTTTLALIVPKLRIIKTYTEQCAIDLFHLNVQTQIGRMNFEFGIKFAHAECSLIACLPACMHMHWARFVPYVCSLNCTFIIIIGCIDNSISSINWRQPRKSICLVFRSHFWALTCWLAQTSPSVLYTNTIKYASLLLLNYYRNIVPRCICITQQMPQLFGLWLTDCTLEQYWCSANACNVLWLNVQRKKIIVNGVRDKSTQNLICARIWSTNWNINRSNEYNFCHQWFSSL